MTIKQRTILMGEVERVASGTEPVCSTTLTRRTLDAAIGPRAPDEGASVTPKCHRSPGCTVWYFVSTGRVLLTCAQCSAQVAWLQVANEAPE
jgi:hypothetical protein